MDDLVEKVFLKLPQEFCYAFLAGCLERVRAIYESGNEDRDPIHDVIELVWKFALGEKVAKDVISQVHQEFNEMGENIENPSTALVYALEAVENALDSIDDSDIQLIIRAAGNVRESVDYFDNNSGRGLAEEMEWQKNALEILGLTNKFTHPITRDIFASITSIAPSWLSQYE